jgi:hypothetical protein
MSGVYVIIDGSWSTEHCKPHIISQVNKYIDDCPRKTFTVYVFTRSIDIIMNRQSDTHIKDYDIGGATSLYDCMEEICFQADLDCAYPPVIVIWTDGKDTSSTRCSKRDIEMAMEDYMSRGWVFDFLYMNPFKVEKRECTLFRKFTHYY